MSTTEIEVCVCRGFTHLAALDNVFVSELVFRAFTV